jgi:hypothetical protein
MYAQLVHFDGPRSPELVAAAEHAGRERVTPAILADPEVAADHVCTYVLRRPDGGETVLTITNTAEMIDRTREIIMSTELLPDEDPALLPGPDRVERLAVVHAIEHGKVVSP